MDRNYYNDELIHFGIKGMKWGVRRYQNADGSLKPAGEKRYTTIREASKKARADGLAARKDARESGQLNGVGAVRKGNKIQREAAKASMKEIKNQNKQAKAEYKEMKTKANKAAVEKYQKKYDEAEKASNMADEKWNNVKEQYKSLGKNRIERMINASRNNTEAAKKYNKAFDDAERASNIADAKWYKVSESYKATGRNRVERIINNVKYDPDKKK